MVAGKNFNIITKVISPSLGSAIAVGSSVAAGMTRYVTFIAISPRVGNVGKGRLIYFCSTPAAATASTATLASAAAKMKYVQASGIVSAAVEPNAHFPKVINTENPLFTVAASKFLTVHQVSAQAGSGACSVFVQYYDQ
jgi:hypothetical protein